MTPIVPRAQSCPEWAPVEWALVVRQRCDENWARIRANKQRIAHTKIVLARLRRVA